MTKTLHMMEAGTKERMSSFPLYNDGQCSYIVPRKKRRCRMTTREGESLCGEHALALTSGDSESDPNPANSVRMVCPLDPKHSVRRTKIQSHLKKCRARIQTLPAYCVKNVNNPCCSSNTKPLTIHSVSDDQLLDVISRIGKIYAGIENKLEWRLRKHPVLEQRLTTNSHSYGMNRLKHMVQNSALLALLEDAGLLSIPCTLIEYGSGRGMLSYCLTEVVRHSRDIDSYDFLLIDKASPRHKFDNKVKDDGKVHVERIRADIRDIVLKNVPQIQSKPASVPILAVSKHLCGAATDFTLRSLEHFHNDDHSNKRAVSGVLIAMCCHHRCEWSSFVGKEYLQSVGLCLEESEFGLLCGLSSWGTCGSGRPRQTKANDAEQIEQPEQMDHLPEHIEQTEQTKTSEISDNKDASAPYPHYRRYERLELPRERREEIGLKVKRVLDYARCQYLTEKLNMQTKLIYYCHPAPSSSLENVALLAMPQMKTW